MSKLLRPVPDETRTERFAAEERAVTAVPRVAARMCCFMVMLFGGLGGPIKRTREVGGWMHHLRIFLGSRMVLRNEEGGRDSGMF